MRLVVIHVDDFAVVVNAKGHLQGGKRRRTPSIGWWVVGGGWFAHENRAIPKEMGVEPKIEIFTPPNYPFVHRVFPYKPSILGYHYCWKHPNESSSNHWFSGAFAVSSREGSVANLLPVDERISCSFLGSLCLILFHYSRVLFILTRCYRI